MNTVNTHPRWWRRAGALAAVLCGLLAALVPVAPASGHGRLVRTTPAAGTILANAPLEVLLTFNEPVSAIPGKL